MLAAYLLLVFMNKKYRPRLNHLTVALAIFLLVFVLTSFTGVNFNRSFWSTYERMTGIFTMLHLLAFFVILTNVFKKRSDWEKFLGASIIVGVILSIYILTSNQLSTRGGGTVGNTSFMAAYLLFDIFFAMILFLAKKGAWQIFAGASLLIMLPVLFTSTARGAIASFLMALGLMFLGYLVFSGKKLFKRIGIAMVLLLIASIGFLAVAQPPVIKGAAQNTLAEMNSRFVVWETGWKGFLEKPLLGWGPENFIVVFLKNFNPCMSLPACGSEVWFDRVHNIFLYTLVTTCVIGLLSYLAIFAVVIYGLIRASLRITEKQNLFIPLGLAVLLVAYLAQNMLVFDMINSYLVFFLALAFASFIIGYEKEEETSQSQSRPLNMFVAASVIGLTIFLVWPANIVTLIANRYIIKTVQSDNVPESMQFFEKSLDTWMEKYETREHFAQKLIKATYQLTDISAEEKEIFNQIFELGEREMEKSIKENPLDFRHHLFAGEVYTGSFRLLENPAKIIRAQEILLKAIELSPSNQQGYWQLAEVNVAQRNLDGALPYLQKAVEIEPKVGRSHWYLAITYQLRGDHQAALRSFEAALDNNYNWMDNSENLEKVIRTLTALKIDPSAYFAEKDKKMIEYLKALVLKEPSYINAWMYLATLYANLGQYDEARYVAQKMVEINPSTTKKVNAFLKSLPATE